MKKYKYLLLSLLISLLIPSTIYAECTEEDLQDFKEKEKEFTIKYEFDKETKMYTITMNYPDSEKYVYGSNDKDFISSKCEVIDKKQPDGLGNTDHRIGADTAQRKRNRQQ